MLSGKEIVCVNGTVIKWFQFVDVIAGENFPELYGALGSRGGSEGVRESASSDVGAAFLLRKKVQVQRSLPLRRTPPVPLV